MRCLPSSQTVRLMWVTRLPGPRTRKFWSTWVWAGLLWAGLSVGLVPRGLGQSVAPEPVQEPIPAQEDSAPPEALSTPLTLEEWDFESPLEPIQSPLEPIQSAPPPTPPPTPQPLPAEPLRVPAGGVDLPGQPPPGSQTPAQETPNQLQFRF